jgi:hypothetical protein
MASKYNYRSSFPVSPPDFTNLKTRFWHLQTNIMKNNCIYLYHGFLSLTVKQSNAKREIV